MASNINDFKKGGKQVSMLAGTQALQQTFNVRAALERSLGTALPTDLSKFNEPSQR